MDSRIIYFAHVPKCGGSSVEGGLQRCGAPLAMKDAGFWSGPKRWNTTSPQHIQTRHLRKLFPEDFFDLAFAVVRDPYKRFLSAFNHAQIAGRIAPDASPQRFAEDLARAPDHLAFEHDNHFTPADRIVPEGSRVFHLENGLGDLRDWLAETFPDSFGGLTFRHGNKKAYSQAAQQVGPDLEEAVREIYRDDYARFYPDAREAG